MQDLMWENQGGWGVLVAEGQQALVNGPLMATWDPVHPFTAAQRGLAVTVTFPFLTFSLKISPTSNLTAAKHTQIISGPHQRWRETQAQVLTGSFQSMHLNLVS